MAPHRNRPILVAVGLAAASIAPASACSSTKEEAAPSPDSGTGIPEAGGTETSAEDAGPTGPTFCEELTPEPFFCADFDDGSPPADLFRTVSGTGAKNDKQALHIVSDGSDIYVEHDAEPTPAWAAIELAFDVTFEALSADARFTLARVGQHQADTECRVELEVEPSALTLRGSGTATAALTKKIATNAKARIVITMDATSDAGNVTGTVTVDGQPAIAAPIDLGCPRLPGPPRVSLGRITGAGTTTLRLDDVVFDGK